MASSSRSRWASGRWISSSALATCMAANRSPSMSMAPLMYASPNASGVGSSSSRSGRAILDLGELAGIELQPDRFVHLEDFVGAGGDAELEGAALGAHGVVPVLAEVGALHDLAGDGAGALAGGGAPAVQVN